MPLRHTARTESQRLRCLNELQVLDTAAEAEFDSLAQIASLVCEVPIALISLVAADRQWFKANIGLPDVAETDRSSAFCAHTILGDDLLEIEDASDDSRFHDNPLVRGAPGIRFYAGVPLTMADGASVGSICVIDRRPRRLDARQREVLRHLANAAVKLLEGRRALLDERDMASAAHAMLEELDDTLERLGSSELLLNRTGEVAGVGGWRFDLATQKIEWSKETCRIHGVAPDFVPKLSQALQFYAPEGRPLIEQALAIALETGKSWDLELPFIRADGKRIWVRAVGEAELEAGKPVRLFGALQDITRQRALTDEIAEQHELLRVTLQSIGDAVITTDADAMVTWLNPVAERMTGWRNDDARGRPVGQVFHIVNEATRAPTENPVYTCIEQGKIVGLASHTVLISRDGNEYGIEDSAAPIRSSNGLVIGVVLVFHDVTEQRRLSGEMSYRAKHDALTGLVNRTEFEARLRNVLDKAHEERSMHALLFIDLDQFKLVNDACGHSAGDQLLQQVSKLLKDTVRARDTLARLGGDEFAVILEYCSIDQAQRVAQQICQRMDDFRFVHDNRRLRIGTSIGLVPADQRWNTIAALMQAADTSCYAAKEAGRNRVHVWFDTDQAMRARHGEMQWAARLEQAFDEDRFILYAQRIEALATGAQGLHAEILIRMRDADGALIQPAAFLPAAERFHLASRIDRFVLDRALRYLLSLPALDGLDTLCINLSGQSIGDRAFHQHAMDALTKAGPLLCRCICLEITETAAVTNIADANAFITQVRALGVRIALDDFGAGASSFGYLKNLDVDILKIDGQFIKNLIDDPLDQAAVSCFVEVARVVGVKTVAEFVDRAAVLERVRELGIDFAQGYHLHQPEPLETLFERALGQTPVVAAPAVPGRGSARAVLATD
ncbi:EAL domain-containing protein [Massilia jejuensis]|uniref:EAL domain-containing protein n=1 Tax=Massilia jejuensis TaxID=648894 RepID=A0ABW0PID0_9BURK